MLANVSDDVLIRLPDVVSLITLVTAGLAVFVLRRCPAGAFGLAVLVTLVGWALSAWAVHEAVFAVQRQIQTKAAGGAKMSYDDAMYDGTGDRVAAVCIGWFFGVAGAVIGGLLSLPTWWRRWRAARGGDARGFPVAAPTAGAEPQPTHPLARVVED
jgi:hypothetical protein